MVYDPETEIDFPLYQGEVLNGMFGPPGEQYERDYMRVCDLSQYKPELTHVLDWGGNPWSCQIYCCWIMIDPLKRAFGLLVERALAGELHTFDGCYNNRLSASGTFTSMHAWGLAVDLNAATNRRGKEPALSPGFVDCFVQAGFEWGGLWSPLSSRDGMHFQLPQIRYPREGGPDYEHGLPWEAT